MQNEKRKSSWVWLAVLLLFLAVIITLIILLSYMKGFFMTDEDAIPLLSYDAMGFVSSDEESGYERIWNSNTTEVEIFKVSYQNGKNVITVASADGDKVVAPGTDNAFTFKLKNNVDMIMDYTVTVDAYFTPEEVSFPIEARLSRYDGTWVTGDENSYVDILEFSGVTDSSVLSPDRFTYYTLEWLWPYNGGHDRLDTILGNHFSDDDITFTIVITTVAAESTAVQAGGIIAMQDGNLMGFIPWILLLLALLTVILIVIWIWRKLREDEEDDLQTKM